MSEGKLTKAAKAWTVKRAGFVWKVYFHGAWARTFNSEREAIEFVREANRHD